MGKRKLSFTHFQTGTPVVDGKMNVQRGGREAGYNIGKYMDGRTNKPVLREWGLTPGHAEVED